MPGELFIECQEQLSCQFQIQYQRFYSQHLRFTRVHLQSQLQPLCRLQTLRMGIASHNNAGQLCRDLHLGLQQSQLLRELLHQNQLQTSHCLKFGDTGSERVSLSEIPLL